MAQDTQADEGSDILVQARNDLRLLKSGGYEHTSELVEGLINEVEQLRRMWVAAEVEVVDLSAIVRDFAASNPQSLADAVNWTSWKVWVRATEWVRTNPTSDERDA
jgi:hypothetical protein